MSVTQLQYLVRRVPKEFELLDGRAICLLPGLQW